MNFAIHLVIGISYVWLMCRLVDWVNHGHHPHLGRIEDRFVLWCSRRRAAKTAVQVMKKHPQHERFVILTRAEHDDLVHQSVMYSLTIKQATDHYLAEQDFDEELRRLNRGST